MDTKIKLILVILLLGGMIVFISNQASAQTTTGSSSKNVSSNGIPPLFALPALAVKGIETGVTILDAKAKTPCGPGEKDDGLVCRKEECPPGSTLRDGLCYSDTCNGPNATVKGLLCEICPSGKLNNGSSLCYTPCEENYKFDGTLTCVSQNKNSGVGKPKTDCTDPAFPNKSGALCYSNCQNGYTWDNGTCKRNCAPGEKDKGANCEKCPDGMVNNGASLCYKPCDSGYDFDGTSTCNRLESKNIGNGTLPNDCPSGWTSWGALCYAPCSAGYTFRDGTCQRNYYSVSSKPLAPLKFSCDAGYQKRAAMCYRNCPDGFHYDLEHAPTQCIINDDKGLVYTPATQERGCGDKERIDSLCYTRCDPGWEHMPGMPYMCRKAGGQSYRTATATPTSQGKLGSLPNSSIPKCPQGTEEVNGLCYSMCPPNFKRIPGIPTDCMGSRGLTYTVSTSVPITRPKETSSVPKVTVRGK